MLNDILQTVKLLLTGNLKSGTIYLGGPGTEPKPELPIAAPEVKAATTTNDITPELMAKAIQVYGGQDSPLQAYAQQIAEGVNKYEFLRDNPYLIPAVGHLETSSGANVTRPNNLLNWGINYPGNNAIFSTMTKEGVLDRALSGLGERSKYYNQFRTGNPMTDEQIMQFAKTYEPANADYGKNLLQAIKFIQEQVNK